MKKEKTERHVISGVLYGILSILCKCYGEDGIYNAQGIMLEMHEGIDDGTRDSIKITTDNPNTTWVADVFREPMAPNCDCGNDPCPHYFYAYYDWQDHDATHREKLDEFDRDACYEWAESLLKSERDNRIDNLLRPKYPR